jgi:hypothetical protein
MATTADGATSELSASSREIGRQAGGQGLQPGRAGSSR